MCRKCCYSKILHPISQRIVTNLWFWWQLVSICVASYMSSLAPFFLDFVSGFYISRLVYYVEWDAIDEIKSIWSLHIITKKVNSIHHNICRLLTFVNVYISNYLGLYILLIVYQKWLLEKCELLRIIKHNLYLRN